MIRRRRKTDLELADIFTATVLSIVVNAFFLYLVAEYGLKWRM